MPGLKFTGGIRCWELFDLPPLRGWTAGQRGQSFPSSLITTEPTTALSKYLANGPSDDFVTQEDPFVGLHLTLSGGRSVPWTVDSMNEMTLLNMLFQF